MLASAVPAAATMPGVNGDIAFRRYLGPDRTSGAIFMAAPDGTGERQLSTPPKKGGDDYPDVSPDGRFVAFQRCRDERPCAIYVVNRDGSGLRRVGRACRTPKPPCSDNSYPAISPDGTQIAFVRAFGKERHDQIDHVGIYRMRLDGSHLRRVSLPRKRTAEDVDPQWSPDGTRISLVRENATARPRGGQAVFVVGADGRGLRRVTPYKLKAGDGPDWSPDGTRLLFRSPETEDFVNSDLFTIRLDGSGLTKLTSGGPTTKIYSASFSPDGSSITFGMNGTDGQADVFTMKLDGSAPVPVTRTTLWDSAPDWGPALG